jgi:hypothetical protein
VSNLQGIFSILFRRKSQEEIGVLGSVKQETAHRFKGNYRLDESYRNPEIRVCDRMIFNVDFGDQLKPDQLNKIQKELTIKNKGLLIYSNPIMMKSLHNRSRNSGIK